MHALLTFWQCVDVSKFSRAPVQLFSEMSAFSEKRRFKRISMNFCFWHKLTFQMLYSPLKRAGGLAGFEVLSRGDRNANCLSDLTLANREFAQLPQNRDKLPGFRAIRGRLFFGFFLLAKQKKETRHRRNPCNKVVAKETSHRRNPCSKVVAKERNPPSAKPVQQGCCKKLDDASLIEATLKHR